MKRILLLAVTHVAVALVGFAGGIYLLPIIVAPPSATPTELDAAVASARYSGDFRRDLPGSDALHWGEGTVSVGREAVALRGAIAPGPAYGLFLSPGFVASGEAFEALESQMVKVGDVRSFGDFVVPVPAGVDVAAYDTVVIWCQAFRQFITAARYR